MKFKSIRKIEESVARNITPTASIALGMLVLLVVCAGLLMSCAVTPEEIQEETARINAQIDAAQADATAKIEEQAAIAQAAKEAAQAIRDNLKESIDGVADTLKDSVEEVKK
tara:strand:+ start:28249 stop:28584 length:336 start_codon:yes stop_codon:yes gene_type:complete